MRWHAQFQEILQVCFGFDVGQKVLNFQTAGAFVAVVQDTFGDGFVRPGAETCVLPQQVTVLVILKCREVFDAEFVGQLLRSSGAQDVAFQERHVWALSRDSRHGGRDLSAFFRLGIRKAFAGFLGNEAQHDQVIAR